jgi:hypothetical protein
MRARLFAAVVLLHMGVACGLGDDGSGDRSGAHGTPSDAAAPPATSDGSAASPDGATAADSGLPVVPPDGPVPQGRYAIQSVSTGKCLAPAGGSTDDGARIEQEACSGAAIQTFDLFSVTAKHVRIMNISTARGFDVDDASGALQQWTFHGAANQEFAIEPQGASRFLLRARKSGRALEATAAGVEQRADSGTDSQRFTFVPIAATPPPGFVRVSGTDLIDGYGYYLLLRGVSLANWLEPEGYMWQLDGSEGDRPRRIEARVSELIGPAAAATFWNDYRDAYTTEDDIARIAALGFNSVRVAMNARLLLPEGQDTFDETEVQRITSVIAWCRKYGVYVILDMHCAPGGQTGTNIDDDVSDQPELYTQSDNQDRLVKIWQELARRYSKETILLGYDLLNEPIAPNHAQYNDKLWPIYQRAGAAIRAVDPDHILIVEGAQWANNWSSLHAPFDDKLVYSFHKYWNNNDQGAIQQYVDLRAQWQRPVWVGESGENDDDWYRASFTLLEKNGIGWAFWPWKKIAGGNDPYDVPQPNGWGAIQSYVGNHANKPSAAAAKATFDALVAGARFSQSTYNEHVVCSLLPCE